MRSAFPFLSILLFLAGCNQRQPSAEPATTAPARVSVTRWSDRTELFMEYPPFVAGSTGRAAVHFTDIHTFKPLTEGGVSIELKEDGRVIQSFRTNGPSSPGIFGVDLEPERPGHYSLSVSLRTSSFEDTHELGEVTVYSSTNEVATDAPGLQEETIPFLKEQQWTLDFATVPAAERELRESLRVAADVQPRSGGQVEVIAPVTGRVLTSSQIPGVGVMVAEGQALLFLVPQTPSVADLPALRLEIAETDAHLEHTRRERQRIERLLEAGAIPAKRLYEAEEEETLAVARHQAAQEKLAQYENTRTSNGVAPEQSYFTVRSPIAGVITKVAATPGSNATHGTSLFQIVAVDRVHVVAHVPEAEVSRIGELSGAEIELPGSGRTVPAGRLVAVSRWIDPASRTLSVVYEAENSNRHLAIGQALSVRLFLAEVSEAIGVPEGAVVDDGGRPVVFVQLEGESFARRPVQLGARASGYVQVLEGVRPGERVVSRGAYLIRLAALSPTIPAHGHVH